MGCVEGGGLILTVVARGDVMSIEERVFAKRGTFAKFTRLCSVDRRDLSFAPIASKDVNDCRYLIIFANDLVTGCWPCLEDKSLGVE